MKFYIFFLCIFVVYFSHVVGLMNSGDAPQYFTTQAILETGSPNLSPYSRDPHYFVWPDYAQRGDQILNMRGHGVSFFSAPLHIVAKVLAPFFTFHNFPQTIITPNFSHEVAVVSLFTLFSLIGLVFVWLAVKRVTHNDLISYIVVLNLALGTYIWKYVAYYSRQGIQVFLLGLTVYIFTRLVEAKSRRSAWLAGLLCIAAASYAIDVIQFVAIVVSIVVYAASSFKKDHVIDKMRLFKVVLPAVIITIIIIASNLLWYKQISSSLYKENIVIGEKFKGPVSKTWMSAPLIPNVWYLLFSYDKLKPSMFRHFDEIDDVVDQYVSLSYAQKYNFYGLLVISPFFLLGLISLVKYKKMHRATLCSWVIGAVGFIATAKYYAFWGGNLYDVRYFYPYMILLALPAAQGLMYLKGFRIAWIFVAATTVWSIYMGFLGAVNMYLPALTGERRIWLEPFHEQPPDSNIVTALFLNRENADIAVCMWIILMILVLFLKRRMRGTKNMQT
ncbi:MAG: hypothetical protein WBO77_02460 [Microgenomates group bacterium]